MSILNVWLPEAVVDVVEISGFIEVRLKQGAESGDQGIVGLMHGLRPRHVQGQGLV